MGAEFDLIARIRARADALSRPDVRLGIGDDCALLAVPQGQLLAVTTDTLVAGVHCPLDTAPADLGWKALAVNLSDLAAMSATPAWASLALTLPTPDPAWTDGFLDGLCALAAQHRVALVGGDTTRGPLSVTLTLHGLVPETLALRRRGARPGDAVWVTGTPGDAAGGLERLRLHRAEPGRHAWGRIDDWLRGRLDRPEPRVAAGLALRGLATACIDVSDGLLADLGHVLDASGVGAEIDLARLPVSPALAARFHGEERWALQLAGGDDYELCFTAPSSGEAAVAAALARAGASGQVIGRITAATGLRVRDPDGRPWTPPRTGYQHFSGD